MAGSVKLQESKVYFRDLDGEKYNFSGILFQVAAVASPLVEDGSGQGLGHPQVNKKKAARSAVSTVVPALRGEEDKILADIIVAPVGTKLAFGDVVISQKSILARSGATPLEKWGSLIPGRVISEPEFKFNDSNKTLAVRVECLQVETSDAEKYRGFGKYRSNGGFLRSILITDQEGSTIFDPTSNLYQDGKAIQAEHVVGAEEFKTFMYVAGIVANDILGEAVWNASTGEWENAEALMKATEQSARKVTVKRWNYGAEAYTMFKTLYANHPDFEFDDANNGITHKNVWCWYGEQAEIVEVPLTKTFMGKCPLFAEHIAYLGTEFPELYKVLLEEVKHNQQMVDEALALAEGVIPGETEENPYGTCAVIDDQTKVITGEKFSLDLIQTEGGVSVVNSITIPAEAEYDTKLVRKMHRLLKKNGFSGIVIESFDQKGEVYAVPLSLNVFTLVTGTVTHQAFVTFARILRELETSDDDRAYGNWSGTFYRLCRMLAGSLEFLVADSNALLAKATKTPAIAFTCRAASTLDASVALDEIHFHPEHLKFWGLESGDFFLIGRVPVPGMGVLRVVSNDLVPYGTAVMNAGRKHEVEEGDVDGDSLIGLAFSSEGVLRKPSEKLENVNPTKDS